MIVLWWALAQAGEAEDQITTLERDLRRAEAALGDSLSRYRDQRLPLADGYDEARSATEEDILRAVGTGASLDAWCPYSRYRVGWGWRRRAEAYCWPAGLPASERPEPEWTIPPDRPLNEGMWVILFDYGRCSEPCDSFAIAVQALIAEYDGRAAIVYGDEKRGHNNQPETWFTGATGRGDAELWAAWGAYLPGGAADVTVVLDGEIVFTDQHVGVRGYQLDLIGEAYTSRKKKEP